MKVFGGFKKKRQAVPDDGAWDRILNEIEGRGQLRSLFRREDGDRLPPHHFHCDFCNSVIHCCETHHKTVKKGKTNG